MRVIPNRKPIVQGAIGLPRMCTKPVGDISGPPPRCLTDPYSRYTKIPLMAEYSPPSGRLP